MAPKTCPICSKRRGKRFCPGLFASRWRGETQTICAQCCGEQREVSIDCPADCPYLLAAHRYEAERPSTPPGELAFPSVALDRDFLEEHQHFIAALSLFCCRFAAEHADVRDADLLAALDALARGFQTLDSGLYYEQPPEAPAARALYAAAREFIEQASQHEQQERGSSLRPADTLRAVVFLRRLGQRESNGRPLTRTFLHFLRAQLPADAVAAPVHPERGRGTAPRLIVPGR